MNAYTGFTNIVTTNFYIVLPMNLSSQAMEILGWGARDDYYQIMSSFSISL
jgi:hypothetical protein